LGHIGRLGNNRGTLYHKEWGTNVKNSKGTMGSFKNYLRADFQGHTWGRPNIRGQRRERYLQGRK